MEKNKRGGFDFFGEIIYCLWIKYCQKTFNHLLTSLDTM